MDKRSFLFVLALSAGLFFVNQWFAPTYEEQEKVQTPEQIEAPVQTPQRAQTPPPASEDETL